MWNIATLWDLWLFSSHTEIYWCCFESGNETEILEDLFVCVPEIRLNNCGFSSAGQMNLRNRKPLRERVAIRPGKILQFTSLSHLTALVLTVSSVDHLSFTSCCSLIKMYLSVLREKYIWRQDIDHVMVMWLSCDQEDCYCNSPIPPWGWSFYTSL